MGALGCEHAKASQDKMLWSTLDTPARTACPLGHPRREFPLGPQGEEPESASASCTLHTCWLHTPPLTCLHPSTHPPRALRDWVWYQDWCEAVNSRDHLWHVMWAGKKPGRGKGRKDYRASLSQFPEPPSGNVHGPGFRSAEGAGPRVWTLLGARPPTKLLI